jgi:hypothetical protein
MVLPDYSLFVFLGSGNLRIHGTFLSLVRLTN